jgi:radical SAM-linked protein
VTASPRPDAPADPPAAERVTSEHGDVASSEAVAAKASRSSSEAVAAKASRSSSEAVAAKVRVRYAKTGKLRFVSAIDLGRVWERALRKAVLPIAYSEGFSPHPKVSFPDALPLGYASTGEYAELTFGAPIAIGRAMQDLNAAFVEGCEVLDAVAVAEGAPRLAKWLTASLWQLDYPGTADEEALAAAVQALWDAEGFVVARERKGKTTELDLRPYVHDLTCHGARVRVVLHHGEPPVRPTEVHQALAGARPDATGRPVLPEPTLITRVAQGAPAEDGVTEALCGEHVALRASPAP